MIRSTFSSPKDSKPRDVFQTAGTILNSEPLDGSNRGMYITVTSPPGPPIQILRISEKLHICVWSSPEKVHIWWCSSDEQKQMCRIWMGGPGGEAPRKIFLEFCTKYSNIGVLFSTFILFFSLVFHSPEMSNSKKQMSKNGWDEKNGWVKTDVHKNWRWVKQGWAHFLQQMSTIFGRCATPTTVAWS